MNPDTVIAPAGRLAGHQNNFDLIRLFAAAQVAYLHIVKNLEIELSLIPELIRSIFEYFPGVPIFFVTSGYLISASYRRDGNLKRYLVSRFLRIYPALWICTGLTLLAILLLAHDQSTDAGASGIPSGAIVKWLVAQVTIGQFYAPFSIRQAFGVGHPNGSLWTIPVELQFYLLLPFIIIFIDRTTKAGNRSTREIIFFGIVILLAWMHVLGHPGLNRWNESMAVLARVTVFPYLYMFGLGILLQSSWPRIERFVRGKFFLWLALYCGASLLFWHAFGISANSNTPNLITMSILAVTILAAAYSKPTLTATLLRGNDISYGIYIYHMVIVNVIFELAYTPTFALGMTAMAITVLTAMLSWFLIERPALRLKSRVAPKMTGPQTGSARAAASP